VHSFAAESCGGLTDIGDAQQGEIVFEVWIVGARAERKELRCWKREVQNSETELVGEIVEKGKGWGWGRRNDEVIESG